MSIAFVREYMKAYHRDADIIELTKTTATVELAAIALDTKPERIAKTMAFMTKEEALVIVCAGDRKIDNHKYKQFFGVKAKMLHGDDVEKYTNHEPGGVCPFALPEETKVYLDLSLQRFDYVYPACGSANSAIRLSCDELFELVPNAQWIDVCKPI